MAILAPLAICAWSLAAVPQDASIDQPSPAVAQELSRSSIEAQLVEARSKVAGAPTTVEPESAEDLLLRAWTRRTELLEGALADLDDVEAQQALAGGLAQRAEAQERARSNLEALPAPGLFESVDEAGYAALEARVEEQRTRLADLQSAHQKRERELESIPEELQAARAREQVAQEREARLLSELQAATEETQQKVLELKAENAALDASFARLEARALEGDRALEADLAPLRADEIDLAERRLARQQEELALYGNELQEEIAREADVLENRITRLRAEAAAARDPAARFLAEKQLDLTLHEQHAGQHRQRHLILSADLEEQKQRLTVELEELRSLREYLEKAGTGEQAAGRIKFTMQRAKLRRQALERTSSKTLTTEISESRSRRFELEDKLFFLKETWQQEVDSAAGQLEPEASREFRISAKGLEEPYRLALREERDRVNDLISVGQELQVKRIERKAALAALTTFIRSKVFWIRDSKPLPSIWPRAQEEMKIVSAWSRRATAPATTQAIARDLKRPGSLTTLLLLLFALPAGLFWVRQRLRRYVTRLNDLTVQRDAQFTDRGRAVAAGILSVTLLPAYVYVTSRSVAAAGLPPEVGPVLVTALQQLSIFLFFWFLTRSFFAGRGTAQVQFGLDQEASHDLHRSLSVALVGYGLFYTAREVLLRPAFSAGSLPLEALPRFAYTLFLLTNLVAGVLLLRAHSAFTRTWSRTLGPGFLGSRWPLFGRLLCLIGVAIVALDLAGYRYSSGVLGRNLVQSLATLFLAVPLFRGMCAVVEAYARKRRASAALEDGGSDSEVDEEGELQFRRFLRVAFTIVVAVVIAGMWGVDQQAFDTLDQWRFYDIRDSGEVDEFVSFGDALRAFLFLMGTYLLLKHLPGIYEYGLFSRLRVDSGVEYAILTISRYGVFTLGVVLALAAIHLDLGRLGWLMAAMGVGLGFGLQEIVSNFVSGIILLIERPVRVGDVVTVGTTSGKVQRINIRATSVMNFDRQEIIVPNRSLITKEVTNWTRGDTIIRLVLPIGVAYGTDVHQVTKLLLELAREQPEILEDPGPQAFFLTHGESSLDFELRVFVPDPSVKLGVQHKLNCRINERLTAEGIEIPFPQRDLHIRSTVVSRQDAGLDAVGAGGGGEMTSHHQD